METAKGLHPYAAIAYTHDSNLLRRSHKLPTHSDSYTTLGAGLSTDFDFGGRQNMLIDANIYRNDYDEFSQFDHTGGNGRIVWRWALGDLWDGRLGYAYTHELRNFENQNVPRKDMIDRHAVFAEANRWLTTRWRAGAGVRWTDVSASKSKQLDREVLRGTATVDYVTRLKDTVGLELIVEDSSYDQDGSRDYLETNFGGTAHVQITPKSRVDAHAGYVKREHDGTTEKDFDGFVGNVAGTWDPTVKTRLVATIYREISNLDDEVANYAVIDGASIEPIWSITEKTKLRGSVNYEKRDFQSNVLFNRKDDVFYYGLWLDWQFRPNSSLSVGYENGDRNSNVSLEDYDYDLIQARLQIGL